MLRREIVRHTRSNELSDHYSFVGHTQDDSPQLPALSLELSHDVGMSALGRQRPLNIVSAQRPLLSAHRPLDKDFLEAPI